MVTYVNRASWKAIQYIVKDTHSTLGGTGVNGVMPKKDAEYAEQNMISKSHAIWSAGECIATIIYRNVQPERVSVAEHAMSPVHVANSTKR